MKGFHYLMKIGHFLNEFITSCVTLALYVRDKGKRGLVTAVWDCLKTGKWPLLNEETAKGTSGQGRRKKTGGYPELVVMPST